MRNGGALVGFAMLLVGCVGEAGARYEGTIAKSPAAGYSFDDTENPTNAPPIAGARVSFCVCTDGACVCEDKTGRTVATDVRGHYAFPTVIFPGMIGVTNYLVVAVRADGYEPFTYRIDYDHMTVDQRTREPTTGDKKLNIRLAPASANSAH
jgi:hypothetical protein